MTNKKRLGEIKEYFSFWMRNDLTRDWGLSQESVDNLKYLIQHAERAESLLKQTGHNFEVNRKLDAENQHYKQTLEFYANRNHYEVEYYGDRGSNDIVLDYGEKAREALEESE